MKLHLGCWKREIPGFVHIDRADFPHIDYNHDVKSLPFLDDETASLIYASHVFEYFDREEARDVLAEWRRVLRPGGVLRLAVPNFRVLAELYLQRGSLDEVLGPLYGRMVVEGQAGQAIYHRTTYDWESLKKLLEDHEFVRVRQYDWRETVHRDYDDFSQAYIPHMDKESGTLISLNVEAEKAA